MARTIQNFDTLATSDLRRDALETAEAGYAAINVGNALQRTLEVKAPGVLTLKTRALGVLTYPIMDRRVFFVGVGKCAFAAAPFIEKLLGEHLYAGIALDVSKPPQGLQKTETVIGTHPFPSEANERATVRIFTLLEKCTDADLIIALISGGGSAMLCYPEAPMTYADETEIFKALTDHGANIQEMNTVRKHLSHARGGGLAHAAYPTEIASLIVSDVPGDDISVISSGPTVRDTTTSVDATDALARYGITLPRGATFLETEKDEKYFAGVTNILFLSGTDALEAMKQTAEAHGYAVEIVDRQFFGEARDIGRQITERLHTAPAGTAFLYAGESTVTNPSGGGRGGRNQEMALGAIQDIHHDELVLPFASDGHDNTDFAGAIADEITLEHANECGIDAKSYLEKHISFDFFSTTRDAVETGYTGSNVSDLIIALKK